MDKKEIFCWAIFYLHEYLYLIEDSINGEDIHCNDFNKNKKDHLKKVAKGLKRIVLEESEERNELNHFLEALQSSIADMGHTTNKCDICDIITSNITLYLGRTHKGG